MAVYPDNDIERLAVVLRVVADILRDAGQEGAYWTLHAVAGELVEALPDEE